MSDELAVPETVRVGFEAALDRRSPNWRTEWADVHVEDARFFYRAALQDTTVFVNDAMQNMQVGYSWLNNNATKTTRETNSAAEAASAAAEGEAGPALAYDQVEVPEEAPTDVVVAVLVDAPADAEAEVNGQDEVPVDDSVEEPAGVEDDLSVEDKAPEETPVESPSAPL